jgi:mono/diheme cytochrome c family protein/DNA-binding beta-propeller fold protein YncE
VLSDGRVLATITDANRLAVLTADGRDSLRLVAVVETDVEPAGLAATSDESTVLVASRTGRTLTAYAGHTLARAGRAELPRDPYSVTTNGDGTMAFVSHVSGGHLTVVALATMTTVQDIVVENQLNRAERRQLAQFRAAGWTEESLSGTARRKGAQGFTLARSNALARVFAPLVLVDPGSEEERTGGYGNSGSETEVPAVAVLDDGAALFTSSLEIEQRSFGWGGASESADRPPCLLPRASAVDDATRTLFVACAGIDSVVAFDLASAAPASAELWRAHVASGPEGLAVDPAGARVVVWSSFDRVVSTLPLAPVKADTGSEPRAVAFAVESTPAHALPDDVKLGRLLFNASSDPRVALDGRGCASCHPSARDDGFVWSTPRGPRRTKVLAGMLSGTAPYSWDGFTGDLEAHVEQVFDRLKGQGGLRPFERRALLRYLESLPLPPASRQEASLVARGRRVFESAAARCSSCHDDARFTDRSMHDVSSRTAADLSKSFDTPSLRRVASRAPFFHDGRYPTLESLIEGVDGTMGKTKHLSPDEQKALVAYLRSL